MLSELREQIRRRVRELSLPVGQVVHRQSRAPTDGRLARGAVVPMHGGFS